MSHSGESDLVQSKLPCECPRSDCGCGSSDGAALYSDNHYFCFVCQHPWGGDSDESRPRKERPPMSDDLKELLDKSEVRALTQRKITQATCEKADYRGFINNKGEAIHVAVYRDEGGVIVAAKMRTPDKEFPSVGPLPPWWGMETLGNGGSRVIIVGGEIDRLTCLQAFRNFPVLSPAKGEKATKKAVADTLDKLSKFDEVIFCLDMDEVGRQACEEGARLLPPGKASIAILPLKDPNEMLMAGRSEELVNAIFHPNKFRPDGIVNAHQARAMAMEKPGWGLRMGFEFFDNLQWGWRDEEIVVHGAGIGMGKSDLMYQVAAHMSHKDNPQRVPIAVFNYEAATDETFSGIAAKNAHKRFDVPDPEDGSPNLFYTEDERQAAFDVLEYECAQVFINDDNGAVSWEAVKERIRYLAHAEGVKRAFVDPMAALVASVADKNAALEKLMAEAKALCKELKIGIWFNSHLSRPKDGKSAEEGGRVTQSMFRGSAAITMWASLVLAMERDTQAEDEQKFITTHRALKCRKNGKKNGATCQSTWNEITGVVEVVAPRMEQAHGDAPPPPPFEGHEQ